MLRHQAAENLVTTSGAAKENSLKEHHVFSEFTHGFCDKMKSKKNDAQKSGQRITFSILISLFFIISQNACLIFFKTVFELLLFRKYGKKFKPLS